MGKQLSIDDLLTPVAIIDETIMETNVRVTQNYFDQIGRAFRPHIKTHKLPMIAKRQVEAGAIGITCQKISEAEAMISEGGIDDVLITFNILGDTKLARLRALAERVRLTVVADNTATVDGLSRAFADSRHVTRFTGISIIY